MPGVYETKEWKPHQKSGKIQNVICYGEKVQNALMKNMRIRVFSVPKFQSIGCYRVEGGVTYKWVR
jgi:hypothetical protein